jgi:hypothetical protein
MTPTTLPPAFAVTREELRRVATHVLARAQHAATGRVGLRPTPGGFGTVQFGPRRERVRVSGAVMVHEAAGPPSTSRAVELDGATLADLAAFAGVTLADELSVGHDTPPVGDVAAPLRVDAHAVEVLCDWYGVTARALDRLVARRSGGPADAAPTLAQLWPEHFDLALDLAYDPAAPAQRRVNLGGSPGDGFHADPYLYVGPWTPDRPGDPAWWNAPFGAVLGYGDVMASSDPVGTATAFFASGIERLGA